MFLFIFYTFNTHISLLGKWGYSTFPLGIDYNDGDIRKFPYREFPQWVDKEVPQLINE